MTLANILAKAGGFRGIAATAAIAWGTSQANRVAEEAQEAAEAALQALQDYQAAITEAQAELERIDAERESILAEMRREVTKSVVADVRAGKYDVTVTARSAELGWSAADVAAGIEPGETFTVVSGDIVSAAGKIDG